LYPHSSIWKIFTVMLSNISNNFYTSFVEIG
jgi:hypothetical protein